MKRAPKESRSLTLKSAPKWPATVVFDASRCVSAKSVPGAMPNWPNRTGGLPGGTGMMVVGTGAVATRLVLQDVVGEASLYIEQGHPDRDASAREPREPCGAEEDRRAVGARRRHPGAGSPHGAGPLLIDPEALSSEQGRKPGEQDQRVPDGPPHTFDSGWLCERW